MSFLTGTPESFEQRFTGGPEQKGLYDQLIGSTRGRGAGGAFGQAGDYYRDLLDDDSSTMQAMVAPEMRQFQQQTIPSLAHQFGGMYGGQSSSGFRQAALGAGTDLAERIANIRAGLRQQGAQGLMGLGQQGLGNFYQNIHRPQQPGFLQQMAPVIGGAIGSFGGPALGALGTQAGSFLGNKFFGQQQPDGAPK